MHARTSFGNRALQEFLKPFLASKTLASLKIQKAEQVPGEGSALRSLGGFVSAAKGVFSKSPCVDNPVRRYCVVFFH